MGEAQGIGYMDGLPVLGCLERILELVGVGRVALKTTGDVGGVHPPPAAATDAGGAGAGDPPFLLE